MNCREYRLPCLGIILPAFLFFISNAHYVINYDVAWLLEVGKRSLAHGEYYYDFYETNPPIAFYIYSPILLLQQLGVNHLSVAFASYYVALTCLTQGLNYYHLQRYQLPRIDIIFFLLFIALWIYVIPIQQLGQRDQIACLLIVPHVLQSLLMRKQPSKPFIRYITTALGFIGYLLKPHFILVWLCLFTALCYQTRSFRDACRHSQAKLLIAVALIYLAWIGLMHPAYLTKMMPLVSQSYYQLIDYSYLQLALVDPLTIIKPWLMIIILAILYWQGAPTHSVYVLALVTLCTGFMLTYLSQKSMANYQAIPALMLSSYTLFFLARQHLQQRIISLIAIAIAGYLIISNILYNQQIAAYKNLETQQLQAVLEPLPKNAQVSIYDCNLTNHYAALSQSTVKSSSILPGIFQACLAWQQQSKGNPKPFQLWRETLQHDFIKANPDYVIINTKQTPAEMLDAALSQGQTKAKWQAYQPNRCISNYVIYEK